MKTKIHHINHLCTSIFASLIVVAVILSATHAKDIANTQPVRDKSNAPRVTENLPTRVAFDEPIQKSIGDLHNHADKTMLKTFAKSMSDAPSLAAKRQERDDHTTDDQPFALRLFEAYFMVQLAYAAYTRA